MMSVYTKILEFNLYQTFDKTPLIIYSDLQCLIEKVEWSNINHENVSTTKVTMHSIRFLNIYDVYRDKYCMKKFCKSLRQH